MSVTGPYYKTHLDVVDVYWTSVWYRQSKPWIYPLGYTLRKQVMIERDGDNSLIYGQTYLPSVNLSIAAHNAAYARFVGGIGESASLGVSIAQYKQACSMVGVRALQLLEFTRALRRLDFGACARILKVPDQTKSLFKRPRRWESDKHFADTFLEWHFGWSPALDDIHKSLEILCSIPPLAKVRGRAYVEGVENNPPPGSYSMGNSISQRVREQIQGWIRVDNPNVHSLQQLGLLNPATVIWDAIPWSFVVGWFVNIGQVINSWSDLAGLSIVNSATTVTVTTEERNYWSSYPWTSKSLSFYMSRTLGFTGPSLALINPLRGLSLSRAATSIALLIQQLPSR
jgi:hypothetical protein